MTEQLVSFETAKAAKEKGFNWKVVYGYTSKGNLTNIVQTDGLIPNFISQFEDLNKYVITEQDIADGENTDNWVIYSAPSQSLLQKWLREVHNINFWLYPQENVCWKNNFSTNSFLKYEDCLENALLFVLTHLEEKSCKRKCKVCEKEFTPDLRNVKKSEKDSKKEKWGLCCSKSCAAKLREMSKPGYIPEKVAANNIIRENWNNYEEDEDPADDMYWSSKNY